VGIASSNNKYLLLNQTSNRKQSSTLDIIKTNHAKAVTSGITEPDTGLGLILKIEGNNYV
jgi:hypothetical protein